MKYRYDSYGVKQAIGDFSKMRPPSSRADSIWPNFFVVGAMKAGTSSLYAYLKVHPQAFVPAMKEPHYFLLGVSPDEIKYKLEEHCIGDQERYQSLYREAGNSKAIGDMSTSYLCDEHAPQAIHSRCPDARIIIILRDPIERAFSHYLMNVRSKKETRPLLQALKGDYSEELRRWGTAHLYVDAGLYFIQVSRYLKLFGRNQTLVVLFDELKNHPENVMLRITSHLGLDPLMLNVTNLSRAYNAYRVPRYPRLRRAASRIGVRGSAVPAAIRERLMYSSLLFDLKKPELDPKARRFLQDIYDPDIGKLEQLLGRELPELRKSWV